MLESGLIPFAPDHPHVPAKGHGELPPTRQVAWTKRQETRGWSHLSLSDLEKVTFALCFFKLFFIECFG